MKIQVILMITLAVIIPAMMSLNDDCERNPEWKAYKVKFVKNYSSEIEEHKRCLTWQKNYEIVQKHNADPTQTYKMAMNHMADLSDDETIKSRGLVRPPNLKKVKEPFGIKMEEAPAKWDWREHNAVSSVKNQGTCGSCWSFSVTGIIESQYFFQTNKLVSFSQQQLVDCDTWDLGCNGGWPSTTLMYLQELGGLETEEDYPYIGAESTCNYEESKAIKMKITDIYTFDNSTELTDDLIQSWIYNYGPVGVAVCSSQPGFGMYDYGIYDGDEECVKVDHAVLLVGYVKDASTGQCYYILKNSWSTYWGMDGYMYISCGSKKLVQFPTVAKLTV